jgi:hypothetical protein
MRKLLDLLPWRTPPVIKAPEPILEQSPPPTFSHLLRFSREELHVAMNAAYGSGRAKTDWQSAARRGMQAVAHYRREKNRLARKQSKPAPAPVEPKTKEATE